MQSPLQRYQLDADNGKITTDQVQVEALTHLTELNKNLIKKYADSKKLLNKLGLFKPQEIQGLYFWGGVGRGKTYLMDLFYDSLPFESKTRLHFHRFMQQVHQQLNKFQSQKDPLKLIARQWATSNLVICLDKFFVSDIGDAMIMSGLWQELFDQGVTLVTTSNIPPQDLYRNGLQRQRFLPTIELLQKHTRVLNVDSGIDYRLRTLEQLDLYYSPLGEGADQAMLAAFNQLVADSQEVVIADEVEFLGRRIPTLRQCEDLIWFEFSALCEGPRSQNDYIEIARCYHTVLLSGMPVLDQGREEAARRFINLVDEFYDRQVKLIISADAPLKSIYKGSRLVFEFERTVSRLIEMQSQEYLAKEHLG